MIALSAYKLANYLADVVPFSGTTDSKDINWEHIDGLAFFEIPESSRNKCYFCTDESGGALNFFFKQSRSLSEVNIQDIRSEAEFYTLARKAWEDHLNSHIPQLVYFDDYNSIIVTKYIPSAVAIIQSNDYAIFYQTGEILKRFHDLCKREAVAVVWGDNKKWIDQFRSVEPKILRLTESDKKQLTFKDDVYISQLVSFLQHHRDTIKGWREEWVQEANGLVHGDADVRNFIWNEGGIVILDFEGVAYGAGFWDVAVFTASLLVKTDLPGVPPRTIRMPPFQVYSRIKNFLEGYGIIYADEQKRILIWSGIYLLQEFLLRQDAYLLHCGLTLIENTEVCHTKIFS